MQAGRRVFSWQLQQHPSLRASIRRLSTAAACSTSSRARKQPAPGDGDLWPISCGFQLPAGLLDVEELRPSLSSSMWPATASVKNSARASTAVSAAAAPQAVRRRRAGSAHHQQQLCSRQALPASPRCTRATRRPFEFLQRIRSPASFGTCAAAQNLLRLLWPSTIKRLPTALQGP